ncbi:MAG: hypothetical protein ABEI98_04790 [Halorhabdus sp.]
MGVVQRGAIFVFGTIGNAILFVILSRAVLPIINYGPSGPADTAFSLLPTALQLVIGALEVGLIVYFAGGLGQERTVNRRRAP